MQNCADTHVMQNHTHMQCYKDRHTHMQSYKDTHTLSLSSFLLPLWRSNHQRKIYVMQAQKGMNTACACTHLLTNTHACAHTENTHTHACTHTQNTHACTHTHTEHTRMHTHTHTENTHACTHTQTDARR